MNDLVKNINGKIVVSSKDVADKFGQLHRHTLQYIKSIHCSDGFRETNFRPSSYISKQNKELPCVEMTRDGFCFLVMGFKGEKGGEWKEKYINAFNEMEKALLKPSPPASMKALNELTLKIEADKQVASVCGTSLANYKRIKKENDENLLKCVKDLQIDFGFEILSGGVKR